MTAFIRALVPVLLATAAAVSLPLAATASRHAATASSHPLVTAIGYTQAPPETDPMAFDRVRAAGATAMKLTLNWPSIAPTQPRYPADPRSTGYLFQPYDREIELMLARGIQPILMIYGTPKWARTDVGGAQPPPTAKALQDFTTAAVIRYSGRFGNIPRVKYWQLWAEPNIEALFSPQIQNGAPVAPQRYRDLLNTFADIVHKLPGNLVVAGGLAPFKRTTAGFYTIPPLQYMRSMFCLSAGAKPKPTCSDHATFDIWAIHPYTNGDAWHKATLPDDVSIPEIPKMTALLRAGVATKHVVSNGMPKLWVTEFSWDTNPPDKDGVPMSLAVRWVSEAFYRMWSMNVSLVTWLALRDLPYKEDTPIQAGLYFNSATLPNDKPKPLLTPFHFPFVAYTRTKGRVFVWGRTPTSKAGSVAIQNRSGSAWRTVKTLRADRYGIFTGTSKAPVKGSYRAKAGSSVAAAFSLKRPKDFPVNPFGGPGNPGR